LLKFACQAQLAKNPMLATVRFDRVLFLYVYN
jgi:hypothetical protein